MRAASPASIPERDLTFAQYVERHLSMIEFAIGISYYQGVNSDQNCGRARYWLTKAALNGHQYVAWCVATIYEQGLGTPVDLPMALSFYRRAAGAGNVRAQYSVGSILHTKTLRSKVTLKLPFAWAGCISKVTVSRKAMRRLSSGTDWPYREVCPARSKISTGSVTTGCPWLAHPGS